MDRTDLQELIEVIAARLRQVGTSNNSGQSDGRLSFDTTAGAVVPNPVAGVSRAEGGAATDVARLVAGLLGQMPAAATPVEAPASVKSGSARGSEDGGALERAARSLVTGFGVASLIKGLFGGDDAATAALPQVPKFAPPLAVRQDLAYSSRSGEYVAFDYSEAGGLRTRQTPAAPVTINVQAMDSKSFLDHSQEIARAVREAMLNSHSLNDLVAEL